MGRDATYRNESSDERARNDYRAHIVFNTATYIRQHMSVVHLSVIRARSFDVILQRNRVTVHPHHPSSWDM